MADCTDGITPKAFANSICWSAVVRYSTSALAWSGLLVVAEIPQQLVNDKVPLVPVGPAGSSATVYLRSGWSALFAPSSQLPSKVIAACPLPNASPAHEAPSSLGHLREPSV